MTSRNLTGLDVSLLGFGLMRLPRNPEPPYDIAEAKATALIDYALAHGINYFDTAYTYGGSEAFAGRALSRHPRESYYLATKCPPWKIKKPQDFDRIFNEQLAACQADYFDFYLVHNFAEENKRANTNNESYDHFVRIGMYDRLMELKAAGKIRRVGFSFHGTPTLLRKLVANYKWDFAQIQLNYIDRTATEAQLQYDILTEAGIPISIMEPLRGGTLATLTPEAAALLTAKNSAASVASWGIRYAASFPNIFTVLSGMNEMEQLTDNIATLSDFVPVTEAEKELLYEAAIIYSKSGAVPCTGCEYCLPCPVGLNIPRNFAIYNHAKTVGFRIPFDNGYATLSDEERASACISCGACINKCPQHLEIPDFLKEVTEFSKNKEGAL